MVFWVIAMTANLVVDAFVGLTGAAGFLFSIMYMSPLGVGATEGLALSFTAFIAPRTLKSIDYNKAGNLDTPFGIRPSLGSLAGTVLGVKLNLTIPESTVKIILYVVVLLFGISILLHKNESQKEGGEAHVASNHLAVTLTLRFVTGAVYPLLGAGGPVLVMSLLVVPGIGIRTTTRVALFNSMFIDILACIGHMMQCSIKDLLPVMAAALVPHGIGVIYGSRNTIEINQIPSREGTIVFLILMAIWKLAL